MNRHRRFHPGVLATAALVLIGLLLAACGTQPEPRSRSAATATTSASASTTSTPTTEPTTEAPPATEAAPEPVAEVAATEEPAPAAAPAAETVTDTGQPVTGYTQSPLNVRSGPGTQHPVTGGLASGQAVTGTRMANGWVRLADGSGYVSGGYVGAEPPAAPAPAPPAKPKAPSNSNPAAPGNSTGAPSSGSSWQATFDAFAASHPGPAWVVADRGAWGRTESSTASDVKIFIAPRTPEGKLRSVMLHEYAHYRQAQAFGGIGTAIATYGAPLLDASADCWAKAHGATWLGYGCTAAGQQLTNSY